MSFLKNINEVSLAGVAFKNMTLKKSIIRYLDIHETATIADLGQTLNISTPKITSTVNELIEEGLMKEIGKIDSTGGRRANMFGLGADAGFFMGVEVTKNHITIGLMNFTKQLVKVKENIPYSLQNNQASLDQLIEIIKDFIKQAGVSMPKILRIGINLTGRIDHITGYNYNFFHFTKYPLGKIIENENSPRSATKI
jgi:hypothetical protein